MPEDPNNNMTLPVQQTTDLPPAPVATPPYQASVPADSTASEENVVAPVEQPANLIQWQASEYIDRQKTKVWFIGLGIATLVLLAVAIFIFKDVTFVILIVVMALAIFMVARRPARQINYSLSYQGLTVGNKLFNLHDFRSFGVVKEGAIYSVSLLPNKRFSPSVNVYFPPEFGEQIVDTLGSVLPMEEIRPDFVDKLTDKLHF